MITPVNALATLLAAGGVAAGNAAALPLPRSEPSTPTIVRSVRLNAATGDVKTGTLVPGQTLGERVFATSENGFGLAHAKGRVYPAITLNGGRTWRIAGPSLLDESAAQAPLVVDAVGDAGPQTFYAYGGGQVVDITSDGGKQWWRATFQGLQVAVGSLSSSTLAAFIELPDGSIGGGVQQFTTTDGGRIWTLTQRRTRSAMRVEESGDAGDRARRAGGRPRGI